VFYTTELSISIISLVSVPFKTVLVLLVYVLD